MYLPTEIIEKIMTYMDLLEKETFTIAYPQYYYFVKPDKHKYIMNNIGILGENTYKPYFLVRDKAFVPYLYSPDYEKLLNPNLKLGNIIEGNITCISSISEIRTKILSEFIDVLSTEEMGPRASRIIDSLNSNIPIYLNQLEYDNISFECELDGDFININRFSYNETKVKCITLSLQMEYGRIFLYNTNIVKGTGKWYLSKDLKDTGCFNTYIVNKKTIYDHL